MDFAENVIARLESSRSFGYHPDWPDMAEPVALSALAFLAWKSESRAVPLLHWLLARQGLDGSVGIEASDASPAWPSGWAVVAWQHAADRPSADPRYAAAVERTLEWICRVEGQLIERTGSAGHDTTIKGWPWVQGTHAWSEPTAMNLLALKHSGHNDHPRAREAVRMLHDRLLPGGGCNYGNTIVFGQELRAHLEPTGLALLALAGERDPSGRTEKSIEYLERELTAQTTSVSLSYALMGLAAHDRLPREADGWLAAAARRTLARDPAPYKLALLALAARGASCPLVPSTRVSTVP
jgi:hypothetical protein